MIKARTSDSCNKLRQVCQLYISMIIEYANMFICVGTLELDIGNHLELVLVIENHFKLFNNTHIFNQIINNVPDFHNEKDQPCSQ